MSDWNIDYHQERVAHYVKFAAAMRAIKDGEVKLNAISAQDAEGLLKFAEWNVSHHREKLVEYVNTEREKAEFEEWKASKKLRVVS